MIDLTEITDKVARSQYESLAAKRSGESEDQPSYDELHAGQKAFLKGALIGIIHQVAVLTEDAVRQEIRLGLDLLPRADLNGLTVNLEAALQVAQ